VGPTITHSIPQVPVRSGISGGFILQKDRPPRNPPFLDRSFDQRLFPREFSLSLLHFDKHDADRIAFLVLRFRVPIKDHEVNWIANEPGISRGERKLRQERGHLLEDPALQRGARTVDGILPDIICAFELPAFEIVSCPLFVHTDSCAEDEVRNDEAEEEGC